MESRHSKKTSLNILEGLAWAVIHTRQSTRRSSCPLSVYVSLKALVWPTSTRERPSRALSHRQAAVANLEKHIRPIQPRKKLFQSQKTWLRIWNCLARSCTGRKPLITARHVCTIRNRIPKLPWLNHRRLRHKPPWQLQKLSVWKYLRSPFTFKWTRTYRNIR